MAGDLIDFQKRRREAQIKGSSNVCDLRAKFQHRSIHDDIPRVEKTSIAFEKEELRTLLDERDKATADGIIRDYTAPMSTTSRPIFSLKECAHKPDTISMEKARVNNDIIYIVRKHAHTPEIKKSFVDALQIFRDELDHLRKRKQFHSVPTTEQPIEP